MIGPLRVAVLDDYHSAYEGSSGIERLRQRAEVRIFTEHVPPDALHEFNALIANRERTKFPRAFFEQVPEVRVIAQTGNHAYHVDLEAAREHGVVVAKATGGYSIGAVELTIGLIISLLRQIPASDAAMKRGEWKTPLGLVLSGKTLGIVGLGHVGRHVAEIARVIGMRVLAWGPSLDAARAEAAGCLYRPLDELLAESDVVSIHATLSSESRGLIDARRLALMKPSAYLVNTARGAIVDEAALVDALAAGRIAGAGLDVYVEEPLPNGHALTRLPNVILQPHSGWPTDAGYAGFADAAADALLAYADGKDVPRFH